MSDQSAKADFFFFYTFRAKVEQTRPFLFLQLWLNVHSSCMNEQVNERPASLFTRGEFSKTFASMSSICFFSDEFEFATQRCVRAFKRFNTCFKPTEQDLWQIDKSCFMFLSIPVVFKVGADRGRWPRVLSLTRERCQWAAPCELRLGPSS